MFKKKTPRFTEDDLESLIKACIAHDHIAEKTLIRLFMGYAKNISLRYSSNVQEAEEIVNDGFLKVFDNLSKFDHARSFKAWIRTIIINTAIDYYRKNQKFANHFSIVDMEIISPDDDILSKISADEILLLVQRLPPSYRMCFNLFVIEGYNHREIADMLGINEGTSKSNLYDARKKLQIMIKNNFPQLYLTYSLKTTKINEN